MSPIAILAPWRDLVDRGQVLFAVASLAAVGLLHARMQPSSQPRRAGRG